MDDDILIRGQSPQCERLREICLALPEATEKLAWSEPTWRVRDRIFAQLEDHHHDSERVGVWLKAPDGAQEVLLGAAPNRFYRPPYVGHKGWVGVYLDVPDIDWDELAGLVEQSYRMLAPKRLLAELAAPGD